MVYSIYWFPIDTTKTKMKKTNQDFFHFLTICTLDFDHSDYITREKFCSNINYKDFNLYIVRLFSNSDTVLLSLMCMNK